MRKRAEKLVQELESMGLNRLTAIHVAIYMETRISNSHTLASGQKNLSYRMIKELEGMRDGMKPISEETEGTKS